jgi:hypothetical protein
LKLFASAEFQHCRAGFVQTSIRTRKRHKVLDSWRFTEIG